MSGQISPGAVPRVCGMMAAPIGHLRLTEVVPRHSPTTALEHPSDDIGDGLVVVQPDAHHGGDRITGQVVVGGAEATAHDHRVGMLE